MNQRPLVSVAVSCYNFEKYIYLCLESLASQEADFLFEIIVVDDHSSDNSIREIKRVMELFPDKIQLIPHSYNRGSDLTKQSACMASQGKYIAFLDGDDFAYQGKLQAQFEYLENNPDCILCYHGMDLVNEASELLGGTFSESFYNQKFINDKSDMKDLILYGTFLVASSQMFRKEAFIENLLPDNLLRIQDFYYHVHSASLGRFGRINQVLGAYRQHNTSSTAQNVSDGKRRLACLDDILLACDYAQSLGLSKNIVDRGKSHFYFAAALYFLKLGNQPYFLDCIEKSAENSVFFDSRHEKIFKLRTDFTRVLALIDG